jgi:hypothetical protein
VPCKFEQNVVISKMVSQKNCFSLGCHNHWPSLSDLNSHSLYTIQLSMLMGGDGNNMKKSLTLHSKVGCGEL